mmetsp:Transcript_29943/g.44383  ORF Transcript_29943/g.44383 Transcript_29943/m.44383 type:complete len:92 (+) Transcript_29943:415-690(+)
MCVCICARFDGYNGIPNPSMSENCELCMRTCDRPRAPKSATLGPPDDAAIPNLWVFTKFDPFSDILPKVGSASSNTLSPANACDMADCGDN